MRGNIRHLLDQLLAEKSAGDPVMEKLLKTKLLIKGVRVDQYTETSEDDPRMLEKVLQAARDFGVELKH